MKTIRWGILSTAKIAREQIIPAIEASDTGMVMAIASRKIEFAQPVAKLLNIPQVYGCYEDLLAAPEIDAIFNPLPNHLHVPWTIRALQAGKHVLCEKPLALDATEAQSLLDTTHDYPHLKVMEAFMYRFHPQWITAKRWVDQGRIGRLCAIQSFFSYFNDDPANIRNQAQIGGGGLMDIGCYCISLSRFIFGAEPQRVMGLMDTDPELQTDRLTSGMLHFAQGQSSFTCSTQCMPYQRVNLLGTQGRIEIEIPFNAPSDRPCRIWMHRQDQESQEVALDTSNQYSLQVDAFAHAILEDTPVPTPLSDAVANMRVIDGLRQSSQTNAWVEL